MNASLTGGRRNDPCEGQEGAHATTYDPDWRFD